VYHTISVTPEIVLSQSPKDYQPPMKNIGNNYKLRGMICYYQKHYDAYFFNTLKKKWYVFDDATVKEVTSEWRQVIERCKRGRYHPCIIWYEAEEPLQISQSQPSFKHKPTPITRRSVPVQIVQQEFRPYVTTSEAGMLSSRRDAFAAIIDNYEQPGSPPIRPTFIYSPSAPPIDDHISGPISVPTRPPSATFPIPNNGPQFNIDRRSRY